MFDLAPGAAIGALLRPPRMSQEQKFGRFTLLHSWSGTLNAEEIAGTVLVARSNAGTSEKALQR